MLIYEVNSRDEWNGVTHEVSTLVPKQPIPKHYYITDKIPPITRDGQVAAIGSNGSWVVRNVFKGEYIKYPTYTRMEFLALFTAEEIAAFEYAVRRAKTLAKRSEAQDILITAKVKLDYSYHVDVSLGEVKTALKTLVEAKILTPERLAEIAPFLADAKVKSLNDTELPNA